jgi:hypothetical protein
MRAKNVQNYAIITTIIYAKEELKVTNIKFVAFQKVLSGATSFRKVKSTLGLTSFVYYHLFQSLYIKTE